MSTLSESQLFDRWHERWEGFLQLVENTETPENALTALRDKVTIGNAERKIAGVHEGREILELLQNARDAIWKADSDHGRVHVGVYDNGVLVANTGTRFDLFDKEVEDAVTMIGETGQGDNDESIGHKGVGLKSILATGDAFEIYTRPDESSEEILGVRLSRSYLVDSVLNRLGHNANGSKLNEDLADPQLQDLLNDGNQSQPIDLTEDLIDAISKLPLFNFPVPISIDGGSFNSIQYRVQQLLTDTPSNPELRPYRTAVFIRYKDNEWRSQLSSIGGELPDEDVGAIEDRPARIWDYLSIGESDDGLQPETVVQLGGIHELHLERASGASDEPTVTEEWTIRRQPPSDTTVSDLTHKEVQVKIRTAEDEISNRFFDHFHFTDTRDHHSAILINKAANQESIPIKSYPLYLFYPIESTDTIDLPFCFHGRFRVETNRKSLSRKNIDTNRGVLEEGIDLIELIGREVAVEGSDSANYSDHLPWVLLPPVPDTTDIIDPSSDELLDWFRQQLLQRLSETKCIPTKEGSRRPAETLLHWDDSVIEGYQGFRTILNTLGREYEATASSPLPSQTALDALLAFPPRWSERLEILIEAERSDEASRAILYDWVEHLDASLSKREGESPAIIVSSDASRKLLEGTVSLLTESATGDDSLQEVLIDTVAQLNDVHLLPCHISDIDPDEELALVTLEQRRTPTGGQPTRRRVRSVIWDIESTSREVERPPTLPQSSNMTVYFLDEEIQQIAEVHHVLSVAGRVWGLRAYEGIPSFVRSLLDTFADGRHDIVEPIDFAFLIAIVDRLGAESNDLQTGEGEFFPLEYLRTAIPQQEGDQRGNLRRRVQLRTCNIELHHHDPRPIAETVLGDEWQFIREQSEQDVEGDEVKHEWIELAPDEYSAQTWPGPESKTWDVFRKQINRDVTDLDFVRTLGLFGAGSLPGLQVLWMYGDDHPSMRQDHHWNPIEWKSDDFTGGIPDSVRNLQSILNTTPDYLNLITSPDHHPRVSSDHSRKCPVKVDGKLNQVNIASWIWIEDIDELSDYGDVIRELIRRHGDSLNSSLLHTGWSCNNGHKRRAWKEAIPSLLNWQLRELDIWDPVVQTNKELTNEWGEQASRLRYAVRLESRRGPQAARMFPYVEGDSEFSDDLLNSLGVHPVHDLDLNGATERLQKLQSVLVDGNLQTDRVKQLWIAGERINDWNQAYTQLLQPVLNQLPESGEESDQKSDWGSLTHLPLRDGGKWVSAPIEWIIEHAAEIKYYQDQSPKPWETQAVNDDGIFILPRTSAGPFTRLASSLGVEQLEASKLVFDPEDDDLEIVTNQYEDEVSHFQRVLAQRNDLLVASTERTDEEEIVTAADRLSIASSNIIVADSFPADAIRQLSDPTSALYATKDGHEALILNANQAKNGLPIDGLAMGISLLVEQPTKVATFRESLREDVSVSELENRWSKRTFPIETVKRVLGSNAVQSLERDLNALDELLIQLEASVEDLGLIVEALEDAPNDVFIGVRKWLATADLPDRIGDGADDSIDISSITSVVDDIWREIPDELTFVLPGLFDDTVVHWVRELEKNDIDLNTEMILIKWLDQHRDALDRPPFDNSSKGAYSRLLTVEELWEQTESTELLELDTWAIRLRELHSTISKSWWDPLQDEHASQLDCPPFIAHLSIGGRVDILLEEFSSKIESNLIDVEFDLQLLVQTYVKDGTIPEVTHEAGAKDHQERAFTELATAITTDNENHSLNFSDDISSMTPQTESAEPSISVSTGGSGVGGSNQFKGRGQQAEAYVMASVLDRVATWLEEYPVSDMIQFRSQFRRLHSDQQSARYSWHVDNVWNSELLPLLEQTEMMDQEAITEWRSALSAGTTFSELPLIRLINVTMERGPGFDVIDPCGPLSSDAGQNDVGLWFTPVEVKAVDGSTSPFTFRLTTNEYRQAKAFIRDGGIPYVIRLVSVPDFNTLDWPKETEIVVEKVIETELELNEIVDSQRFEEIVKGGYMNMRIE